MIIPILNADEVASLKGKNCILYLDAENMTLKLKNGDKILSFGQGSEDSGSEGSEPETPEPETPDYGVGALRVSGFTDLNDEVMGLSYPFSNFNGIYRKNSDSSYEKIYDLNNNPVSTPYFILMTSEGYWCLCETSTISHHHSSTAYHDDNSGVMPPTTENGITWFYSGFYDKTLKDFTIEVI